MIIVIIIVLILIVMLLFYKTSTLTNSHISTNSNNSNCKYDIIRTLLRQSARWSIAASQDKNAMIAVLHANYGVGYLWALKDIATDQEILEATNIDILQFRDNVVKIQDNVTKYMASLCPEYAPTDSYLARIAGEL